jgi:hypothetical protein
VLGRYRLERRLGAGGFGTVWLAHDERLGRPVALKRIPVDGGGSPRAEREALAAARLGHPGIVALYDTGHDDEAFYLASELVRGRTLADLERDGALSDRDVVRIGSALCEALEHAHARGVVHRDVKPGNVMVGDAGAVKLCDFGIARLADLSSLTLTGDVVGTIAYMAPEQAEGRRVTGASDLYSLALVLYEALTGTNPVRAEGAAATARRVGMVLPALGRVRPDLPPALADALDRALEPGPGERGTLAELREALDEAEPEVEDVPGVVEAGAPEGLAARTRAWWPRRREPQALAPVPGPPPLVPPAADDVRAGRGRPRERAPEAWPEEEDAWREAERASRHAERWPEAAVGAGAYALALAEEDAAPRRPGWRGRLLAGLGAGALFGTAAATLPVSLPGGAEPAALAAAAALAVAVLPRLGWLAAAVALVAAFGAGPAALLAALALAAVAAALPRAGAWWSLPAAAPALATASLGVAFPALAGLAPRPHVRAALGALGALWLAAAPALASDAAPVGGALTAGTAATAALWALAAAVLPLLVRGRGTASDAIGATVWAVALAAATPVVAEAAGAEPPDLAALGAAAGAAAAVLIRTLRL